MTIRAALTLGGLLAVTAMTTSALAALPEILPGSGTFTGKSTSSVLFETASGEKLTCSSATFSGEITSTKTGTGSIDFTKCSTLGFALNSLGDASGTILASGELTGCYISESSKDVGLEIRLPEGGVHAEVPAVGSLFVKKGALIFLVSPVNSSKTTFSDTIKQSHGKPEVTKCEGGPEEISLVAKNEGTFQSVGVEASGEVTFSTAHEIMA